MSREIIDLAAKRALLRANVSDEKITPRGIITKLEQEVRTVHGVAFSPRSRQLIVAAEEEARAFNQPYVGTDHLLLALLREDFFMQDFMRIGINHELIERILLTTDQKKTTPTPIRGYTNRLQRLAFDRADKSQERRVHFRQLVLADWPIGLLESPDGMGVDLMYRTGLAVWRDEEALLLKTKLFSELPYSE